LKYEKEKWSAGISTLFNGWKHLADYSSSGEDNLSYATPDGMPSWITLNLTGKYSFSRRILVTAGIENILDRNYRVFASGISAPGRNFILAFSFNL
jgi:hemoglobin/transferrin/lactoferrin receptor protein